MPANPRARILEQLARFVAAGQAQASSSMLATALDLDVTTVWRHLEALTKSGQVIRTGAARATRYQLPVLEIAQAVSAYHVQPLLPPVLQADTSALIWSAGSLALQVRLAKALKLRKPVTHNASFVADYVPNVSSLLPEALASELHQLGGLDDRQPAGTYARRVYESLLLDLSWSSSRLEGNTFSLLDTRKLFDSVQHPDNADARMLLNHKAAIEFMTSEALEYGLKMPVVRNVHSLLMQGLLADNEDCGKIRHTVVGISGTAYMPMNDPHYLQEKLEQILLKAEAIQNPIESAFFVWVNIAYLQPFVDGNKRTSRLAANLPLLIYNCAPLSFLGVEPAEYAQAMLGVYEFNDLSMAVDLFAWTYRRSIEKYALIIKTTPLPDPFRTRYRQSIIDAVQMVVWSGRTVAEAISEQQLTEADRAAFTAMLERDLALLGEHNCAPYRLPMKRVRDWVAQGRPQ